MKKMMICLLFTAFYAVGMAQNTKTHVRVQPVEGGINLGMGMPFASGTRVGKFLSQELRFNLSRSAWDIGVMSGVYEFDKDKTTNGERWKSDDSNSYIALTGHYNFSQGCKLNPFVGMGVGLGINSTSELEELNVIIGGISTGLFFLPMREYNTAMVFIPRAGIEAWGVLRLTGEVYISSSRLSGASLSLGVVFGGKKKRVQP